jgi:hypothetical protein
MQNWYFTFGMGSDNRNKIIKIFGSWADARQKMHDTYGDRWAFQYDESEGERLINEYSYEVVTIE